MIVVALKRICITRTMFKAFRSSNSRELHTYRNHKPIDTGLMF